MLADFFLKLFGTERYSDCVRRIFIKKTATKRNVTNCGSEQDYATKFRLGMLWAKTRINSSFIRRNAHTHYVILVAENIVEAVYY